MIVLFYKGEFKISVKCNIKTKEPKFYFNEYGAFYEGQILERYCFCGGNLKNITYVEDIKLIKFIVHYNKKTREPELYFRLGNLYNKVQYTISCNQLGILYKIKRRNFEKSVE